MPVIRHFSKLHLGMGLSNVEACQFKDVLLVRNVTCQA